MRLALALLLLARFASAQCPDGSAPPCASARAPRTVDPARIAILPFRVTTSDTLLGEGFAELLASEFSNEESPRAVDMATVISAWRRAGGGLRSPLPRDKALNLARELGAGLVSEGSIVGIGDRITITTSILTTTTGSSRGRPTRVSTSSDSVDHALRQTVSGLVAALGGQQRTLEGARFTESPEAMRAYLEGLTLWRRGRLIQAQSSFERAMTLDTSFAQAAFRRYLTSTWVLPPGNVSQAEAVRRTVAQRARLSASERGFVEALLGTGVGPRPPMELRLPTLTRMAEAMPDSPEAQYMIGDSWFHYGMPFDHVGQLARAREYMTRAIAIDSVATAIRHLLEINVRLHDTAALRRLLPVYARTEDVGRWAGLFVGYSILRDESALAKLRAQSPASFETGAHWPYGAAVVADMPAARFEEIHRRWAAAAGDSPFRALLTESYATALMMRDRPVSAEAEYGKLVDERVIDADRSRLWAALSGHGQGLDVVGSVTRLSQPGPQQNPEVRCEIALFRFLVGADATEELKVQRERSGPCPRAIHIVDLMRDSTTTIAKAAAADSALRAAFGQGVRPYEPYLLSRLWEHLGRNDRAYAALRYRTPGSFYSEALWLNADEIRLGLALGDTTHARRLLEFYLPIIADAEPPYTAKRDSLRALLTQLKRR